MSELSPSVCKLCRDGWVIDAKCCNCGAVERATLPGSGGERDAVSIERAAGVAVDPCVKPSAAPNNPSPQRSGKGSSGSLSRCSREMYVVWLVAEQAYRGRLIWSEEELSQARAWTDRGSAQEYADTLGTGAARVVRVCTGRDRRKQ